MVAIALSYPPRVRVRATAKLSAAFFSWESSVTIGGGGGGAIAPYFHYGSFFQLSLSLAFYIFLIGMFWTKHLLIAHVHVIPNLLFTLVGRWEFWLHGSKDYLLLDNCFEIDTAKETKDFYRRKAWEPAELKGNNGHDIA